MRDRQYRQIFFLPLNPIYVSMANIIWVHFQLHQFSYPHPKQFARQHGLGVAIYISPFKHPTRPYATYHRKSTTNLFNYVHVHVQQRSCRPNPALATAPHTWVTPSSSEDSSSDETPTSSNIASIFDLFAGGAAAAACLPVCSLPPLLVLPLPPSLLLPFAPSSCRPRLPTATAAALVPSPCSPFGAVVPATNREQIGVRCAVPAQLAWHVRKRWCASDSSELGGLPSLI